MRHYTIFLGIIVTISLSLFGVAEAFQILLLTDPQVLHSAEWFSAILSTSLLISDPILPIPASLIMIANGANFGVLIGTLLSFCGSLGAGLFAFYLGRCGGPLVKRFVPEEERRKANGYLAKWGGTAILVSRPIPILAESVAILAGASPMGWYQMALATAVGSLPVALLYAVVGATVMTSNKALGLFGAVILLAGIIWVGRRHKGI